MSISFSIVAAATQAASVPANTAPWSAPETYAAIGDTMREHLFDPAQTRTAGYRQTMDAVHALVNTSARREDFVDGFNRTWRGGPFSHVRLDVAHASAAVMADRFDRMRVGGNGAALEWRGGVAILTVKTMMGLDTIEQIDAAYAAIAAHAATAVIVDLRANAGGAFAVRPLVSHVLSEPLDAGVFIGARWFARNPGVPDMHAVARMPAWDGWSLKAFWKDVEQQGVLRIRFDPATPTYAGPIYVLTSHRTASAAEMAADALQARGRAIVVGERTAGHMLSQKMYDVPGGLRLSLPIADYRSHHGGRIEGKGVQPDIVVAADQALARALALAADSAP